VSRHREERGSAVVIAIILTAAMLVVALGAMAMVDSSQRRSGEQRSMETTFNLAEGMLNNEMLVLARSWPSTPQQARPPACAAASTTCPSAANILAALSGPDAVLGGATWSTSVRDNIGGSATTYSAAASASTACGAMMPCTWDSNGDGMMWIRADATVAQQSRSIVALARQELSRIAFPRNSITAGFFRTSNNGLKVIVDEKGCLAKTKPTATCNSTDPAPVVVRCTTATPGTTGDTCLGYRSSQVNPDLTTQGLTTNVQPPATLQQMKTYAIQRGSYFTSCPSVAQLTGPMVFIDGVSCSYTTGTVNSAAAPGVLAVNAGTISFGGSLNFYGVLYAANNLPAPADAGAIVNLSGGAYVQGAIFVEGRGGVLAGSSGLNVSFDPNALGNVVVASTPSLAQNSFRELVAGQ
jgi:Tfp pilus assembly protein PilX